MMLCTYCILGDRTGGVSHVAAVKLAEYNTRLVPATHVARVWQDLITGLTSAASPSVDISSTCKVFYFIS